MQRPSTKTPGQHRAWVGPSDYFDRLGALQFVMLLTLGMREDDTLLDVGCGSLRGGRFSLVYLKAGHYFGIEPEAWCLEQGIAAETGPGLIELKKPTFSSNADFDASHFGRAFDYIMAAGIFMHTCLDQVKSCFRSMADVLAPDGVFVGAYLAGDSDSREAAWTYPDIQRYRASTLVSVAQECGLRLVPMEVEHPLDHQWFVATRCTSSRALKTRQDLSVFSWREYLADQIRIRGGVPQPHEHYLKHELNARLACDDAGVVPQARL